MAEDCIKVFLEEPSPQVAALLGSLNCRLPSEFPSITVLRTVIGDINQTIVESGMAKHASVLLSPGMSSTATAQIFAELARPAYSLGANLNQKGEPSFEANLSYPSFSLLARPCILQATTNATYPSGGSLSAALVLPRLHDSTVRYTLRAFAEEAALADCVNAKTRGIEIGGRRGLHELNFRVALRANSPSPGSQTFYDTYGQNRLRSERISLMYKFCLDKTRYLRERPSVATNGWSVAGLVDLPVVRTDTDNVRVSAKASKYFRVSSASSPQFPVVFGIHGRAGANLCGFFGKAAAPVAVNDKFFLGGASEDLLQFPGFKSKGACMSGALAFSTASADVSFDLLKEAGVRASLFIQGGLTTEGNSSLQTRVCFGGSLILPMGARRFIRVIAAKPVVRDACDKEQLFTIGITTGNEL